ncbi:YqhG family protein [Paenibacillus endoradicis]|uniref:YqhG family protein n=1 Tax=Paenibacillus endoradicis TaxID=2972487 RepID=UPI002159231C|nr:YqhG family protein [Paenibacillus endoradicis]MCR8655895.1 YqhG family protein [Paenibacillus endoradicis]MCR8658221.1 YqhG family protein [Paenibacillus endoradicis]
MNSKEIHRFVQRYLEATQCSILEKSPYHFKVKLSPAADRELTNRYYYWSFIDRVNETPETMSFLFVTDDDKYNELIESTPVVDPVAKTFEESSFERAYGLVPKPIARVPREHLHYGSGRLEQLFQSTQDNGSYVCLFQEPNAKALHPYASRPYTVWLGVNYCVEFSSDRKREEIHSLGISLVTGHCVESFQGRLEQIKLSPRIPPNIHIAKNGIAYAKALSIAEQTIERKLKNYDYRWAEDAQTRLIEELARLASYYEPMLEHAEDDERREHVRSLIQKREEEIRWQYEPRITVSVINCGLFHLDGID